MTSPIASISSPVLGWIILAVMGLAAMILLEWIGERILGARFFKRRSSVARVLLVVAIMGALGVLALAAGWAVLVAIGAKGQEF